jgi:cell division protein FtsI (penicillin-binding protein 3)
LSIKEQIVLRARIAFLFIALVGFAIIAKIAHIQLVQGEMWSEMAAKNSMKYRKIKATRGNIYTADGSLLATSLPFYKLALDPSVINDSLYKNKLDSLCYLLSAFYNDKSAQEYKRKIKTAHSTKKRYLVLNPKMINYQDKKMMSQWPILREGRTKGGVIFDKVDKRFLPFSNLAQRTVGFVNEENKGVGLEYSFNQQLAGRDGEALFQKIQGNHWEPVNDGEEIKPIQGIDIKTTIDINIQDVAEASLYNHLKKHDAEYGCVVLMEVKTGEIKAIANLGRTPSGNYVENYNYAIGPQGLTEPGSTIKLASMIALFEETNIQLDDTVDTGDGKYVIYDRTMTDSKDGGYGVLTVKEVFEKSSNIGVSKLIMKEFESSPSKYIDYLKKFGYSTQISFQMKGEAIPEIKNPKNKSWSGVSLPWMSIGYEMKISPLHTLMFYNAIANDGKMIKPIIVKEVMEADKVKEKYKTEVINNSVCSGSTLKKVRRMLEGVVENGTAKNIKNPDYKIAGKTGTAQRIVNKRYTKSYYTSFVGYFPADNPKYSCIVVIDYPKTWMQYGNDVAAPVFREVADKIYSTDLDLHKPKELKRATDTDALPLVKAGRLEELKYLANELGVSAHGGNDNEWVIAQRTNNAIKLNPRKTIKGLVPDVTGMTMRDALYLLENNGLKVRVEGKGRVEKQSFSPGQKAEKGSEITIWLS